jgi:hypothetical protein
LLQRLPLEGGVLSLLIVQLNHLLESKLLQQARVRRLQHAILPQMLVTIAATAAAWRVAVISVVLELRRKGDRVLLGR